MLFKINDSNNKFVEYVTLCVNENDFSSFFGRVVPKLQKTKFLATKMGLVWDFNSSNYRTSPIKIHLYGNNSQQTYYFHEIVSCSRQKRIDEHNSAGRVLRTAWTNHYYGGSISATYSTSTYAYTTGSSNFAFGGTYRVQ
jgi:hypothetical protein